MAGEGRYCKARLGCVCVCVGGGFVTKASRVAGRQTGRQNRCLLERVWCGVVGGRGGDKSCTVYPLRLLASSCMYLIKEFGCWWVGKTIRGVYCMASLLFPVPLSINQSFPHVCVEGVGGR